MAHMWATSNTAEASFVFFYLTIAGALFVIFLSENLTTLQIQTYNMQRELGGPGGEAEEAKQQ